MKEQSGFSDRSVLLKQVQRVLAFDKSEPRKREPNHFVFLNSDDEAGTML